MPHKLEQKNTSLRKVMPETFVLAVGVLFVLLIFQPFGTDDFEDPYKYPQLFGYGAIILLGYPAIKLSLMAFFKEHYFMGWKKEFLLMLITSTMLLIPTFFYYCFLILGRFKWEYFPSFSLFAFTVFLPFLMLITYDKFIKEHALNKRNQSDNTIKLIGDNRDEEYLFKKSHLVYLQSEGNYVKVVFLEGGQKLSNVLIRGTLTNLARQLPSDTFVKSHRSYLVNKSHFPKLTLQDTAYTLGATHFEITVPVSKSYLKEIKQKWKDFS